ncbi:MAG: CYTH and CHAD domain-containing protein [Propionivibrio sp.]
MAKEIELKLGLPAAQARRVTTHSILSGYKPQKYRLFNTYYDTPEFDLRSRGIALRLRRKGWTTWLMTVKGGASGAGGLAQRSEWEAPTQPGVFDFSIVGDEELREFLESCHARLQAVFSTDFMRTAWIVPHGDAVIEVALDRGNLSAIDLNGDAGTVKEKICELELELVEGESSDPLFDLAIRLAAEINLHPEIVSKAERGYALADPTFMRPVKATVSPLTREMSLVEAFRSIALACVLHLQRNEAGAIAGRDPEFVHQARVAIRRLRSAFRLFAPVLAPDFVEVYAPRWKALAGDLGDARDWDVFLDETLAPLEEAFPGDADLAVLCKKGEAAKAKAQLSAGSALSQVEYNRLVLAFSAALLRIEPPTIAPENAKSVQRLRKFARQRLRKCAFAVEELAREHGKMNAERRHELRIAFKKLRYALDFFAPLFSARRLTAYQSTLSSIQDLLGTLNDQVTAARLIKELHPKGEPQPLTKGWIAGRTQLLLSALNVELRRFRACRCPWD